MPNKKNGDHGASIPSFGTAVMGERGQIVIPKEIRDQMRLKKGEQIMVMFHNESIMLITRDKMEAFVKQLTSSLKPNKK